jgi:hypothetical protein
MIGARVLMRESALYSDAFYQLALIIGSFKLSANANT